MEEMDDDPVPSLDDLDGPAPADIGEAVPEPIGEVEFDDDEDLELSSIDEVRRRLQRLREGAD